MKAIQRNIISLAKRFSLEIIDLKQTGGDHYKMQLRNDFGMQAFFIFANSTSDKARAEKNNAAKLRRFAEGQDPRPQR